MPSNCGAGEDSWKSLGQKGDPTSQSSGKSTLNTCWKGWCWSWSSSILVIWCEQLAHWKSPWCWERLRAEGEEGIRGWDGWTASQIKWTRTWANFRGWWGTGRPGVLQSMGRKELDTTGRPNNMTPWSFSPAIETSVSEYLVQRAWYRLGDYEGKVKLPANTVEWLTVLCVASLECSQYWGPTRKTAHDVTHQWLGPCSRDTGIDYRSFFKILHINSSPTLTMCTLIDSHFGLRTEHRIFAFDLLLPS